MSAAVELQPMGSSKASSPPPPYPPPPRRAVPQRDPSPGSLGRGYRQAEDMAKAATRPVEGALDAASVFGLAAAGWLTLMALPVLVLPRFILFLAQGSESGSPSHALKTGHLGVLNSGPVPSYDRGHYDSLTSLESFLLHMMGMGMLALAALCVFVIVPTYTPVSKCRVPAIGVLSALFCFSAIFGWNAPLGALAVLLGLGNGVLGCWGAWSLFFGNEEGHNKHKILKPNSRLKRL